MSKNYWKFIIQSKQEGKDQESTQSKNRRVKVSKGAKTRNRYNQVPHLNQDTNKKVTNSQLDTTNESQEVSPFPAGDHNALINRRVQRHSKHKKEKHKRSIKEEPHWKGQCNILLKGLIRFNGAPTSP